MLKQPTWIWSIPVYFYVGGVAGMGAALGAAAHILAPDPMRSLVQRSRWIGAIAGSISAVLLIHDLGRPARFLYMLRVFRISSPMSMGSWILTAFSTCTGGACLLPAGPRFLRPAADILGSASGFFGLALSGYTGVLLSQTAVPVWQVSYRTMPVLFLASGAAAAAALFEFFAWNRKETKALEVFGTIAKISELMAVIVLEHDANHIERVGRPLKSGLSGLLWQSAKALTLVGIVLSAAPGKGRAKRISSGVIGTVAGLCLRFGIFYAGKASARDPRASFEQQRMSLIRGS
jgi:formate-dependent nitrite reductase membrane component NrfD